MVNIIAKRELFDENTAVRLDTGYIITSKTRVGYIVNDNDGNDYKLLKTTRRFQRVY